MTTPGQYQHKLSEFDLTPLDQPLSDATRPALEQLQAAVRQIEGDINREIHVIRNQYQTRINSVNRGGGSQVLVSNRAVSSDRHRADQINRLETEMDEKIGPYQEVKSQAADLLAKVEAALTGAQK